MDLRIAVDTAQFETVRGLDQTQIGGKLHEALLHSLPSHLVNVVYSHSGGRQHCPDHTGHHGDQRASSSDHRIDGVPLNHHQDSIGHQIQIDQCLDLVFQPKLASRITGGQSEVTHIGPRKQLIRHKGAHRGQWGSNGKCLSACDATWHAQLQTRLVYCIDGRVRGCIGLEIGQMVALFGGHAAGLLRAVGGYLGQNAFACLLHLLAFAPYAVLKRGRFSKAIPIGTRATTHLYDLKLLLPCSCLLHLSLVCLTTTPQFHLLLASLFGRFCSRLYSRLHSGLYSGLCSSRCSRECSR